MISAGKGPDPAKPNNPKVDISQVVNPNMTPPSTPFSGRGMADEQRSNMAMGMLAPSRAQPMSYASPAVDPLRQQ